MVIVIVVNTLLDLPLVICQLIKVILRLATSTQDWQNVRVKSLTWQSSLINRSIQSLQSSSMTKLCSEKIYHVWDGQAASSHSISTPSFLLFMKISLCREHVRNEHISYGIQVERCSVRAKRTHFSTEFTQRHTTWCVLVAMSAGKKLLYIMEGNSRIPCFRFENNWAVLLAKVNRVLQHAQEIKADQCEMFGKCHDFRLQLIPSVQTDHEANPCTC